MNDKSASPFLPAHWCSVIVLILLFGFYPLCINLSSGYYGIDQTKIRALWTIGGLGLGLICILGIVQCIMYQIPLQVRSKLSLTDICVLAYSVMIILAVIFSIQEDCAWYGQTGWYVGGGIILIINGLYFAISRFWRSDNCVIWVMLVVSAAVFVLGILNRFNTWPFEIPGSYKNYEYISTLGNINWYNGYLSVVATVGIARFVLGQNQKRIEHVLLAIYTLISFMTALSQGGDTIFLYFAALFSALLFFGSFYKNGIKRWLQMFMIWAIAGQIIHFLRSINLRWYKYDSINLLNTFNNSYLTLRMFVVAFIVYLIVCKFGIPRWINKLVRILPVFLGLAFVVYGIAAYVFTYSGMFEAPEEINDSLIPLESLLPHFFYLDDSWGSGRGTTIRTGAMIFSSLPWTRKLFGIGPDCFAVFIEDAPEILEYVTLKLGNGVLANAHCEPLTSLVNIGIIGTIIYYMVWLSFLYRCYKLWKEDARVITVAVSVICFLTYNILNFTQILNFPFAFLLIAMGEAWMKQAEIRMKQND